MSSYSKEPDAKELDTQASSSRTKSRIKIGASVLVLAAIALQIWHLLTPLPTFLETVLSITNVVLIIHAVEGIIGAILILLYKLRTQNNPVDTTSTLLVSHLPESTPLAVLKAGLYVFFVGTVGLSEIIQEAKAPASSQ